MGYEFQGSPMSYAIPEGILRAVEAAGIEPAVLQILFKYIKDIEILKEEIRNHVKSSTYENESE